MGGSAGLADLATGSVGKIELTGDRGGAGSATTAGAGWATGAAVTTGAGVGVRAGATLEARALPSRPGTTWPNSAIGSGAGESTAGFDWACPDNAAPSEPAVDCTLGAGVTAAGGRAGAVGWANDHGGRSTGASSTGEDLAATGDRGAGASTKSDMSSSNDECRGAAAAPFATGSMGGAAGNDVGRITGSGAVIGDG